ncbi:MAG: efflux RND transporter periplasmic adaptor subunit [Planctomycetota bacterium]
MKVASVLAKAQEVTDFDEYVGRASASETVEVRARVTGYIKTIEFQDGETVDEDQLLFTIEPDVYEASHDQAVSRIEWSKAKVTLAEKKLARADDLIKVSAISQEEFEENVAALAEAKAQGVSAVADSEITALDLKYTKVKSPIGGRIDRALVTPGNIVTGGLGTGTLLTTIVKNDPMYVYFDVDEKAVLRYQRMSIQDLKQEGQSTIIERTLKDLHVPARIQLADESDYLHEGVLDFLQNRIDEKTGSIQIRAVLQNSDQLIRSGMFVRVRVPSSKPYDAVLVPEQSIGVEQDTRYVIVVEGGKTTRRTVELGRAQGDMRVITKGLQAGEEIIYRGLQRVRPNVPVEVTRVELPANRP